jgi:hypothetical protein
VRRLAALIVPSVPRPTIWWLTDTVRQSFVDFRSDHKLVIFSAKTSNKKRKT